MPKTKFDGAEWWESLPEPHKSALEGSIIYDQYFGAILGYVMLPAGAVLVYDAEKCIDELAKDFEAPNPDENDPANNALDDAIDYFGFNVEGLWAGDRTPLLLHRDIEEDDLEAMRKTFPGFVGYATRCSDDSYAIFAIEALTEDPITVVPPCEDDPITIRVLKLIELPEDT